MSQGMDSKASLQSGPTMNMNMNNIGMGAGGTPASMDHGGPQHQQPRGGAHVMERQMLNTYIYDYFLKNEMLESAKAILKAAGTDIQLVQEDRPMKNEHEMNGVDDAMDTGDDNRNYDSAKTIGDLPRARVPPMSQGSFLFEWWCCFMDIYYARNKSGNASQTAVTYVQNSQAAQRIMRNEAMARMNPAQQQAALMGGGMNIPGYPQRMMMAGGIMQNGMQGGVHEGGNSPGDMTQKPGNPQLARHVLAKQLANHSPGGQMSNINRPRMMQVMQRSEPEINEMNGQQRPQSPAASGASPGVKRQRLEDGRFEPVPNGRGQPQPTPTGSAANAHQLLIANGINPTHLTALQFANFQGQAPGAQQRQIAMYAQNMAANTKQLAANQKVMPQNPGQAGSPMMPQPAEGGHGAAEFYQAGPGGGMRAGGGLGGSTGNHALQDYQVQLMLLEQQNKKRLMMARAEQDNITAHGGDANRPGGYPQGMSPGSRAAPSPGPGGKPPMAGTPKMPNQVGPGSPLPDGQMGGHVQQRSSPASAAGFNGQMQDGQHPVMMYKQMENMGMLGNAGAPNGRPMMPPNFNGPMGQPGMDGQLNPPMGRPPQGGRGQPGAMWQQHSGQPQQGGQQPPGGPQQQQAPQQGQQQVGTPQQGGRNLSHASMPPPQAPTGTNPPSAAGRPGAPASPQVSNQQPPTPTQPNKPPPKKVTQPAKKARQTKKGNPPANAAPPNAVTPSATSEPPTPTTPRHPEAFNSRPAPGAGAGSFSGAPPPAQQQPTPTPQQQDNSQPAAFMDSDMGGNGFDLFQGVPGDDSLLDNFDFDSYLNTGEDNSALNFGGDSLTWTDSGEVGAADS